MNTKSRAQTIFCAMVAVFVLTVSTVGHAQSDEQKKAMRRTNVVQVVEKVLPSVVSITAEIATRVRNTPWDQLFGMEDGGGSAVLGKSEGSGVIIHSTGYVVTNDHVVARAKSISVDLNDGRSFKAQIVGSDPTNDIAILKLDGPGPFPFAVLGRSDEIMLGEPAIALGNPFGLHGSVTEGIISAVNRPIQFQGKDVFTDFMQTSAVINPGNSGGPLSNVVGEIIGINVAIHSRGPGIGFAIPINRVREVVHKVMDPRMTKKAFLGIDFAYQKEEPGVRVTSIDDNGPAKGSGIRVGDWITAVNGRPLSNWIDFHARVADLKVGDKVSLAVSEGGATKNVVVAFAETESPIERAVFEKVGFKFEDLSDAVGRTQSIGGVLVKDVFENSSAASIGLAAGDVLISFGGYTIRNASQLIRAVQTVDARGQSVVVQVLRDGSPLRGTMVLGR